MYCTNCGRKLMDGEVCNCQNQNAVPPIVQPQVSTTSRSSFFANQKGPSISIPNVTPQTPEPQAQAAPVVPPVVENQVAAAPTFNPEPVVQAVVETPIAQAPFTETPAFNPEPVVQATVETPIAETPVVDTPVVEAPAFNPEPVVQAAVEIPIAETPVVDTLVVDTLVVEAPAFNPEPAVQAAVEIPVTAAPAFNPEPTVQAAVETPIVETPVTEPATNNVQDILAQQQAEQAAAQEAAEKARAQAIAAAQNSDNRANQYFQQYAPQPQTPAEPIKTEEAPAAPAQFNQAPAAPNQFNHTSAGQNPAPQQPGVPFVPIPGGQFNQAPAGQNPAPQQPGQFNAPQNASAQQPVNGQFGQFQQPQPANGQFGQPQPANGQFGQLQPANGQFRQAQQPGNAQFGPAPNGQPAPGNPYNNTYNQSPPSYYQQAPYMSETERLNKFMSTPKFVTARDFMGSFPVLIYAITATALLAFDIIALHDFIHPLLLLMTIASWITYISGVSSKKNNKLPSTAGLSIASGVAITMLVIWCIAFGLVIIALIGAMGSGYGDSGTITAVMAVALACSILALVLGIRYYLSQSRNMKNIKFCITNEDNPRKFSIFPSVILIIGIIFSLSSLIGTISMLNNTNLQKEVYDIFLKYFKYSNLDKIQDGWSQRLARYLTDTLFSKETIIYSSISSGLNILNMLSTAIIFFVAKAKMNCFAENVITGIPPQGNPGAGQY